MGTGRDVIPRSLESAVLHPKRTDRCRVELHMRGPDCPGLSWPSLRLLARHCLTAMMMLKLPHENKSRGWPRKWGSLSRAATRQIAVLNSQLAPAHPGLASQSACIFCPRQRKLVVVFGVPVSGTGAVQGPPDLI